MELLLLIGGAWIVWLTIRLFSKSSEAPTSPRQEPRSQSSSAPTLPKVSDQTFQPSSLPRRNPSIQFKSVASDNGLTNLKVNSRNFEGLHDAFTGAPLNIALGLYQCQKCQVFYHTESLEILREVNGSQCVSCQTTNIASVVPGAGGTTGKDYTPNVITLANYMQYEGSVVTFEGRVHKVNESRRGSDFAVMFENKSWRAGFKLVFFRRAVTKVGGKPFITSLQGKTIKVRGLIVKHPTFGYEIIISEKAMILSTKQ